MGKDKKKKRSREKESEKKNIREMLEMMQSEINNLKASVAGATEKQSEHIAKSIECITGDDQIENEDPNINSVDNKSEDYEVIVVENTTTNESLDASKDIAEKLDDEILNILGEDPAATIDTAVNIQSDLAVRWKKWIVEGVSEEIKKQLLKKYSRKGDLYTESPKINLEILPAMSEIGIKRDKHFVETQNCVGSAITALGDAISMLLSVSDEGVDRTLLLERLCDAGKLITDVFHQQSVARKSFISPTLSKNVRPTLEASLSDEWLYGTKFAEKVKDAKNIEKTCSVIKAVEKSTVKKSVRPFNQLNWKSPPVRSRQVGGMHRPSIRAQSSMRFKPYVKAQTKTNQRRDQSQNRVSSKK